MRGEIVPAIPALLTWAAVIYELPLLRRRRDAARRSFWLTLFFLSLALTVLLPAVSMPLDALTRAPNLSRLLGNGLVLVAAWAVQTYLFRMNYPDARADWRIHRRTSMLVGVLALMIALFASAPVHREASDFWQQYGTIPSIVLYRLLVVGYLGLALFNVFRLSWRYAGVAVRPTLSLSLRLVAVGALFGLGYCLHSGLHVATLALGTQNAFLDSNLVTQILITLCVGLIIMGSTMPTWGDRAGIPLLYRWGRHYFACRRLYPLWRTLYNAHPQIALLPPPSPLVDLLTVRDLEFRLYRRVVEIRDGMLALRPYVDGRVVADARERCARAGLPESEARATAEATSVAAALDAKQHGFSSTAAPSSLVTVAAGSMDLESEVTALELVARCYRRSPIVRAVLDRRND